MRSVCVITKPRKMGSNRRIDSLMPRRLRNSSTRVSAISRLNFAAPTAGESKENNASTPLATEIETVKT